MRAQILTGGRGDQPRKSGCCHGHREQLCEWQPRSAHKCEGGGWRMIQGMVVGNERIFCWQAETMLPALDVVMSLQVPHVLI